MGLVDSLGYLPNIIDRAAELGGIEENGDECDARRGAEAVFELVRNLDLQVEAAKLLLDKGANVAARDVVIALKLDKVLFDQLSAEVREKFKNSINPKTTVGKPINALNVPRTNLLPLNFFKPRILFL